MLIELFIDTTDFLIALLCVALILGTWCRHRFAFGYVELLQDDFNVSRICLVFHPMIRPTKYPV